MISVAIVLATQLESSAAWPILGTLFLAVIAPTAFLLLAGVRSGRWQDTDVSVREERKRFYPWAIPISALGVVATWLIGAPFFVVRGGLMTFGLLVAAAVINAKLKISLHTLFAAYCMMILFQVGIWCGTAALVLAALVFWSRLFLGRHTAAECLAGAGLGVVGGILTAW